MTSKHFCENCDYKCEDLSNWNKHIKTAKHLGTFQKSAKLLECKICEFTCNKQSKLDIHMMTDKHKNKESGSHPCYTTIITQLLNQNSELKNFIIEQANEHKNFVIEQAAEHKKETVEILNKVIENVKPVNNNNTTITNNNKRRTEHRPGEWSGLSLASFKEIMANEFETNFTKTDPNGFKKYNDSIQSVLEEQKTDPKYFEKLVKAQFNSLLVEK